MSSDATPVDVRRATRADLQRITEIYNQAILHTTATFDTDPKTTEQMEQWFGHHDDEHPVTVATVRHRAPRALPDADRQTVIGWASISAWSDRCAYSRTAELSLYVDEQFHGRGAGRALFERMLDDAPKLGFHTLISRIAGENDVSIHLHERFGFEHIGTMREVGMKFGRLLDVHLYQLIFADRT